MRFRGRPFNPNGIWGFSYLRPMDPVHVALFSFGALRPHFRKRWSAGVFSSPLVIRDSVWVKISDRNVEFIRVWSLPRSWNLQIWGTQFWPMTRCLQCLMNKTTEMCFFRRSSWTWGFENVGDMQYELWPNMSDSWLLLSGTPEKKYLSRRSFRL
jgi:hypothetical protein